MPTRIALLGLAVLLAAAPPLAAQGRIVRLDSAALTALATLEARIDSAPALRLRTLWSTSILAQPRLLPSGLGFSELTGPEPRIDGRAFVLQTRGRATGTGRVGGAVVLGAAAAAYGLMGTAIGCIDAERGCGEYAVVAVGGGVVGALVGALIGSAIGSLFPGWQTIYRHPDP